MGKPNKKIQKAIDQYDYDGNFIRRFNSISEAKKAFGTKSSHFGRCADGRCRSAFGYV